MQRTNEPSRFDSWIRTRSIADYVLERQNEDGGYTFAQWSESSAQDTYFAIQILRMLDVSPVRKERTIAFLRKLQHSDGGFDSIKVAYYVTKSLKELGATLEKDCEEFILQAQSSLGRLGSIEVNIEASSEIETTHLFLETSRLLGRSVESDTLLRLILSLKNHDGSFGQAGYSHLASLYYALASLKVLGYDVNSLDSTLRWVRGCENPAGGFARNPNHFEAYLILDEMYYGLKALEVFGEPSLYPSQNLNLIAKFQNSNGGFRRSIFLGISTFESTFHALSCLQLLMNG